MELGNIDLSSFTTPIEFSFNNLSEYKFGGVYIIFSINKNGIKQIVKIGESNFIYRRIANYLSPLEEKDKNNPKKITKRTIQSEVKKGIKQDLSYEITWKIVEDLHDRKELEKELIKEFKQRHNGKGPIMNKNNR